MVYTINIFSNWSKDFACWEDLKSWLTSEQGGNLRVVEPKESPFALVRYNKGVSKMDMEHVRWCRSVVVHKESRLPVSVSPPKSSTHCESMLDEAVVAEEFVDGTMINAFSFKDAANELLTDITTRSRIGADCKFFDEGKTFKEMFHDALAASKINNISGILPGFDTNDRAVFTSVVLQHSANRIVQNIVNPVVQIVHQGFVNSDGIVRIEEDTEGFVNEGGDENIIQPFVLASIRNAKSIEAWVDARGTERGVGFQGIVLKDGKGKRWRFRNHSYDLVRNLRGNETNNQDRFARLRHNRAVEQYLAFYPEDREAFYELEGRLRKNTRQLSQFYVETFRARKVPYHQLPWPYKHHVSVLHNMFKDTLKAEGRKVDMDTVIRYVNGLSKEDFTNMCKIHKTDLITETKNNVAVGSEEKITAAEYM
jgi:hypothetical protein